MKKFATYTRTYRHTKNPFVTDTDVGLFSVDPIPELPLLRDTAYGDGGTTAAAFGANDQRTMKGGEDDCPRTAQTNEEPE